MGAVRDTPPSSPGKITVVGLSVSVWPTILTGQLSLIDSSANLPRNSPERFDRKKEREVYIYRGRSRHASVVRYALAVHYARNSISIVSLVTQKTSVVG